MNLQSLATLDSTFFVALRAKYLVHIENYTKIILSHHHLVNITRTHALMIANQLIQLTVPVRV